MSENVGDTGRQLADRIDALAVEMQLITGAVTAHVAASTGYTDAAGLGYMVKQGGDLILQLREYARRVREGDYKPATVWRKPSATRG